jgi:hypothetical protein
MFKMSINIRWYIVGALIGLATGVMLYFLQPVQWQGQALIRIGQLSQNQNQNQNPGQNQSLSIEPLATVIERVRSRSFIMAVATRAKKNEIVGLLDANEGGGLTIKPTRNADSLVITLIGRSAELIQIAIDSLVAELVAKHDALIDAYQSDIRKELSQLNNEIDALSERLAAAIEVPANTSPKLAEERGFVTGFRIMSMQHDLDYKQNRASILRESISSSNIRPTFLIEPASVSQKRLFPRLLHAVLFGGLLGIFASILFVQWRK